MNPWQLRFEQHPIHSALATLSKSIAAVRQAVVDDPGALAMDLPRIEGVVERMGAALAAADPLFVPPQALDQIAPHIQNASANLLQYPSTRSAAVLQAANAQLDTTLYYLGTLIPPPRSVPEVELLGQAATRVRKSLEEGVSNIAAAYQDTS